MPLSPTPLASVCAPGGYSARYAGGQGEAQANVDKRLDARGEGPADRRGAHFHAAIVLLRHAEDPQPLIAEGSWHGRILYARRGVVGFGYDPVFLDPERGRSAAELDLALKNSISHRGLALASLRERLAQISMSERPLGVTGAGKDG